MVEEFVGGLKERAVEEEVFLVLGDFLDGGRGGDDEGGMAAEVEEDEGTVEVGEGAEGAVGKWGQLVEVADYWELSGGGGQGLNTGVEFIG